VRPLIAVLLSLILSACGQSGSLYFAESVKAQPTKEKKAVTQPGDDNSDDDTDPTTGP
jgi:predicted small lipoprotein YifL